MILSAASNLDGQSSSTIMKGLPSRSSLTLPCLSRTGRFRQAFKPFVSVLKASVAVAPTILAMVWASVIEPFRTSAR